MDVKYYAGLFDADGSFGIQASKLANGNFTIHAVATVKQVSYRDQCLRQLAEDLNCQVYTETFDNNWEDVTSIRLVGRKAQSLMEKLKNHLVIKKEVVEFILNVNGQEVNEVVLKAVKKLLKELRYEIHPLRKNHPSRRWMAGYVDGDGCLRSQIKGEGLITKLEVTSYSRDTQGVELLQKAFGGSICKHGNNAIRWVKHLNESNANKILGFFSNHSKIKRAQILFVLDYLNKGKHLKSRGATLESNIVLKETLQNLKQPQRLTEEGRKGKL